MAFSLPAEISRLLTAKASAPTRSNVVGISRSLTTSADMTIFEALVQEMEKTTRVPVHDVTALRKRESKKAKGDLWESFCKQWLLTLPSQPYANVWLLSEVPSEVLSLLGLKRVDSGIDLIAQIRNVAHSPTQKCGYDPRSAFVPIQCKFRGKTKTGKDRPLQWEMVNSYVALCSLTGPWRTGLIMTNTTGFGRRSVPVANRFRTMGKRTFMRTGHLQWCRMAGLTNEYRLGEPSDYENDDTEREEHPIVLPPTTKPPRLVIATTQLSVEEMREARLRRLGCN